MSAEDGVVGVVAGLPVEARPLSRLGRGRYTRACGLGPARAREAARSLLAGGACALMSWGTAAALDAGLAAGCVVVPETVFGSDGRAYAAASAWRARVRQALDGRVPLDAGPLEETASVLRSPQEKSALARRRGARAADMESAAIAEAARQAGVPFLVVRAIVDSVDTRVPECAVRAASPEGTLALRTLLGEALAQPSELAALARLALGFRAAHRSLRRVARLAAAELLHP